MNLKLLFSIIIVVFIYFLTYVNTNALTATIDPNIKYTAWYSMSVWKEFDIDITENWDSTIYEIRKNDAMGKWYEYIMNFFVWEKQCQTPMIYNDWDSISWEIAYWNSTCEFDINFIDASKYKNYRIEVIALDEWKEIVTHEWEHTFNMVEKDIDSDIDWDTLRLDSYYENWKSSSNRWQILIYLTLPIRWHLPFKKYTMNLDLFDNENGIRFYKNDNLELQYDKESNTYGIIIKTSTPYKKITEIRAWIMLYEYNQKNFAKSFYSDRKLYSTFHNIDSIDEIKEEIQEIQIKETDDEQMLETTKQITTELNSGDKKISAIKKYKENITTNTWDDDKQLKEKESSHLKTDITSNLIIPLSSIKDTSVWIKNENQGDKNMYSPVTRIQRVSEKIDKKWYSNTKSILILEKVLVLLQERINNTSVDSTALTTIKNSLIEEIANRKKTNQ